MKHKLIQIVKCYTLIKYIEDNKLLETNELYRNVTSIGGENVSRNSSNRLIENFKDNVAKFFNERFKKIIKKRFTTNLHLTHLNQITPNLHILNFFIMCNRIEFHSSLFYKAIYNF